MSSVHKVRVHSYLCLYGSTQISGGRLLHVLTLSTFLQNKKSSLSLTRTMSHENDLIEYCTLAVKKISLAR